MGFIIQQLLMVAISIIIIVLSTIYIYFKYSYNYWSKKQVPYLKPTFPFGNTKDLMLRKKNFGDCFADIYRKLKEKSRLFGGFYFFGKPMLMLINPEIIKHVLGKDFGHFQHRGMFADEENDPLSAHLVSLEGTKWKNMRAKLTPTFTSGKMKMMFHTILSCCKNLDRTIDKHIEHNEAIDIREIFSRLTTDAIVLCAFGLECNSLENPENEFRHYGKKIFDIGLREIIINMMTVNCPWLLKLLKIPQVPPDVTKFFMSTLKQTVDYREKNGVHRKDFLDLLIRLKNNQSVLDDSSDVVNNAHNFTFNELAAQAFVFYAAGFETTSAALNFCLYELASNIHIQDNVRREVRDILQKYNGEISYDAIMDMKYMDNVFHEVLRKYPPIPMLIRECTENYEVAGTDYVIEKGTPIFFSTFGLQNDAEYYPDPEIFDPERFNEETKSKRHPYTYLPFGEGPRICIGMRFALLQMKLTVSILMKNYKFTLDARTVTPIEFDPKNTFLAPKNKIWLRAYKI